MMKDFFISYNKADRDWAVWIAWHLEEAGYSTVIQAWDFRPGCNFALEMDRAAKESERTIVVLSADFLGSRFTAPEWAAAFASDPKGGLGKILPIKVRECEPAGLLAPLSRIDLIGMSPEDAKIILLEGISRHRAKPKTSPSFPGQRSVQQPPHFPGTLPPIFKVPFSQSPYFSGRDQVLSELHAALISKERGAWKQALTGMGGVGKTQIAIEYAFRHKDDYAAVWWINSEEPAVLAGDYSSLAEHLYPKERIAGDQAAMIVKVRTWLEQNSKWLLIFDNAKESKDLKDYLPKGGDGHILITSRNPNWGSAAKFLPIRVFGREESIEFLTERTGQEDSESAENLALELGDLPLALEQAGAYIEETGISLSDYGERFRDHRKKVLGRGRPSDYPETVATTWEISFQAVKERSPSSLDLLNLCSFLAPDGIPRNLLIDGSSHLPKMLASIVSDPLKFDEAAAALIRYSLVTSSADGLSVHRLIQAVTRDGLAENDMKLWAQAAVEIVNKAFPFDSDDFRNWPLCALLLPHALAAASHAESLGAATDSTSRILNQTGLYLKELADYEGAKNNFERALAIGEKIYGPDHPNVAIRVNNLGLVLKDLGDLQGAKKNFERALAIDEKVYGPDHPNVAIRVNNLGLVLKDLGDLQGAKNNFERALAIGEKIYGPDHPQVAIYANNLGNVLQDLGDLQGAKKNCERALAIDEKVYGPDHPQVAIYANNLGRVLQDLGDLQGAKRNYERALAIGEKIYGPDHPNVAIRVNNLGNVLQDLGDLQGAKRNYERALAIGEKIYGPDHPQVAIYANNLGNVLQDLGDLQGAKRNCERALAIDEKVYGPDHPNVAIRVNNLGHVLQDLGDLQGAKRNCERALAIFRKFLGDDHPSTKIVQNNLSLINKAIRTKE
jgi:tetratricopeptide (TPR) repeat protein